ncbi:uncharacterized protein JCM10292_002550 [Rhodotorula paludigena]|uniref:uncharacterized protein n=1 Tax=Rhodotorula paludigena TaxID=86838 RepID=UPI00317AEF03
MLPYAAVHSAASTEYDGADSTASSSAASSPRTRALSLAPHDAVVVDLAHADSLSRPSTDSQPCSDAYDSAGEGTSSLASSLRSRTARSSLSAQGASASGASVAAPLSSASGAGSLVGTPLHYGGAWSGDEGPGLYSYGGSRVSSRANSPAPGQDAFDGYLSYRSAGSRNRSRNTSGYTTPESGKEAHGAEYYQNHHYQTSALLRKLGGKLAPEEAPVFSRNKRKPGWWARRAETRRKNTGPAGADAPLLGAAGSSKAPRDRSCVSMALSAFLRQPWVPTRPFTILFALLLFGCFAATLTTFLVNVLSSDREPPPWRQYCQEQRDFPHALADSLKPVNVFVGVFSVDAAEQRRNAIRLSYGKHSKPIDPRTGKPAHNVQLKFILGRPRKKWAKRIALEMEMFNDLVVLDVEENMNKGKTFKYFSWASENATVPVYYSPAGEAGMVNGVRQVAVGFQKADYVVKADDDSFIVLSELERHLRITPRENTYWGYLIRNRFMAGEVYALSADLVQHVASYPRPKSATIGKEDQRLAWWMRKHPKASQIHWITERCQIYDHPKAGTTYSRGFTFPDHVEQVRAEGRRGISEEEQLRRGGELWQSYSTVSTWKKPYSPPAEGLSIEEEVEALVEGGGRWAAQGWRSDNGRGPEAVQLDRMLFSPLDARLVDRFYSSDTGHNLSTVTDAKPGAPDRSVIIPSARTTRFGKDLFRDPEGVRAVNHLRKRAANVQEGPTRGPLEEGEFEIHNLVRGPFEDGPTPDAAAQGEAPTSNSSTAASDSSSSPPPSSSPAPIVNEPAYVNEPTGQIRLGQHAYAVPSYNERFLPAATLRFDPATRSLRQQRMLNQPHGGTVAVHYLKRNEWFYETALALLGRERMWDAGSDAPAYPSSPYESNALLEPYAQDPLALSATPPHVGGAHADGQPPQLEVFPALWGGARMYGSPIVTPDGMIVEGRRAEANRERLVQSPPAGSNSRAALASRLGRVTGGGRQPLVMVAEMDGVAISVGGEEAKAEVEETTRESAPASSAETSSASKEPSAPSLAAVSTDSTSAADESTSSTA